MTKAGQELTRLEEKMVQREAWKNRMYLCPRGVPTIGVGHNLRDRPISDAAVLQILRDDIDETRTLCMTLPFWYSLNEARQEAVMDWCFNVGLGGLHKSPKALGRLSVGDWRGAAREILDGPLVEQVGNRAREIAKQIETGEFV